MTLSSPFVRRIMGVFATRVVRFALGFVISFTLARILGPTGRGIYSVATLTPTTLVNLGQFGLPNAFSFFAGRGRSGARLLVLGLLLSGVLSVALLGATLLALPYLADTVLRAAPYELLLLAVVTIPFQLVAAFAGATLIGRQTMRNYNLILIGQSVLMVILIVALVDGARPVLIDQPEDALDIPSVYEDVTLPLRGRKHERQFIVTTHNPTVAVAGDSDKFHVLRASAKAATVSVAGAIDRRSVRTEVLQHLEGGNVPLQLKIEKYQLAGR